MTRKDKFNLKRGLSKIKEIRYPRENGTLKEFFTKNRWDIVTEETTYYVYDYSTIRTIEILMSLCGVNEGDN